MFNAESRDPEFSDATFIRCLLRSIILQTITQLENFKSKNLDLPIILTYGSVLSISQLIKLIRVRLKDLYSEIKNVAQQIFINAIIVVFFTVLATCVAKVLYKRFDLKYLFRVILYSSEFSVFIFLFVRSGLFEGKQFFVFRIVTCLIGVFISLVLFIRNIQQSD